MVEDFSRCMNKPLPPVEVRGVYYNNVEMYENPFTVKWIETVKDKFYAVCDHVDEFSGETVEVRVYAYYLSKRKE